MGVAGDLLLSLVGVVVIAAASLEVAFGTLIVFWLLVPGTLIVPHAPHLLLVDRLVLYAFALRLLLRRNEGEPTGKAFSLTPVHGALGVLLLVGFFDGVILAPNNVSLASDLHLWLSLLDLAVLFVVVLASVRAIGPVRSVTVIVCVLTVAVLIGIEERFFHHAWAHFFFEGIPGGYLGAGSGPLAARGGHLRSQGAAQFALEYGWVLAALLPLVVVTAIRWSKGRLRMSSWLAVLLPVVVLVTVVFAGSRSAELGGVIAAVILALLLFLAGGNNRSLLAWGGAAVAAGAFIALIDPSLITSPFSTGATTDPASVRLDRLPPLFSLVVSRPFTGLGFNGISSVFGGIDNAYALVYATLGVLGVLAWLALTVTALASTARSLRAREGDAVAIGAACLVGIATLAVAASSYDLVNTAQSCWALVILAAIGTTVAETVPRKVRARRRWLARVLLPIGGVALGSAVLAAAPTSASETLSIFTVAPWVPGPVYIGTGTEMVDTLCPSVTNPDTIAPGTSVRCLQGASIFESDYAGLALVTVRGPSPSTVRSEVKRSFTPIFHYMPLEGGPSSTMQTGEPSWAKTAPLSGGAAGLLAMFLVPPIAFRRRRSRHESRGEALPPAQAPPERELVGAVSREA